MIKENYNGRTRLIAEEGKILTNGANYCTSVYIHKYDCEENWAEVDFDRVPVLEDIPYEEVREAINIVLGGI